MKRNVFVTGSSRGIGFAIAKEFAYLGDRVVLNCRADGDRLAEALDELKGYDTMGILADMSDYKATEQVFLRIKEKFGPVDILVNNAGSEYFGLFTDMNLCDIRKVLDNNLYTVFNATHLAAKDMVRAKSGIIINISSIWGRVGASCEAVYSAAKGAVNSFTLSMAKELGPSGIRVCAVALGLMETRMNDRLSPEERAEIIENISLMRIGKPEEAAKLVRFLASEDAAYLSGQIIGLDGGMY